MKYNSKWIILFQDIKKIVHLTGDEAVRREILESKHSAFTNSATDVFRDAKLHQFLSKSKLFETFRRYNSIVHYTHVPHFPRFSSLSKEFEEIIYKYMSSR